MSDELVKEKTTGRGKVGKVIGAAIEDVTGEAPRNWCPTQTSLPSGKHSRSLKISTQPILLSYWAGVGLSRRQRNGGIPLDSYGTESDQTFTKKALNQAVWLLSSCKFCSSTVSDGTSTVEVNWNCQHLNKPLEETHWPWVSKFMWKVTGVLVSNKCEILGHTPLNYLLKYFDVMWTMLHL